jgi:hypothetical protein
MASIDHMLDHRSRKSIALSVKPGKEFDGFDDDIVKTEGRKSMKKAKDPEQALS